MRNELFETENDSVSKHRIQNKRSYKEKHWDVVDSVFFAVFRFYEVDVLNYSIQNALTFKLL